MGATDKTSAICIDVRKAYLYEEALSDEQRAHVKDCPSCRAFLKDSGAMRRDLAFLEPQSFKKDGVPLADAVMREIRLQKAFGTRKTPVFMRHIGLVAALAIITVASFPLLWKNTQGNTADKALPFAADDVQESAADGMADSVKLPDDTRITALPASFGTEDGADDMTAADECEGLFLYQADSLEEAPPESENSAPNETPHAVENQVLSSDADGVFEAAYPPPEMTASKQAEETGGDAAEGLLTGMRGVESKSLERLFRAPETDEERQFIALAVRKAALQGMEVDGETAQIAYDGDVVQVRFFLDDGTTYIVVIEDEATR